VKIEILVAAVSWAAIGAVLVISLGPAAKSVQPGSHVLVFL